MRIARRRRLRRMLRVAIWCAVAVGALAWAIRTYPGFGPALANGLRRVFGIDAVARLEERVAEVDDARKRAFAPRSPRPLSEAQDPIGARAPPPESSAQSPSPLDRQPKDVEPLFPKVAAPEDGRFVPVRDPAKYETPPVMFSTMLHPDPARPWAELFIVTMLVSDVELWPVAGTREPAAPRTLGYERTGLIRLEHEARLLAAFNGGFRAEHGHHGMMVDGIELLPPRAGLCTIRGHADHHIDIASSPKKTEGTTAEVVWWRQTPPCMVEDGQMHPGLRDESTKTWGATIEGSAVIRRSAVGLSADGGRLFVGISNDTTARAIALGMQRAGALDVAQLDVNWSYPRFLLFPRDASGKRHAMTLFRGFLFHPDDYLRRPSARDFFYVVHGGD